MGVVLVLASYVALSRVGSGPVAAALIARGHEPIIAPTTVFGRHPGWGDPGGEIVAPDAFASMIDAIAQQGGFNHIDGIYTGYFGEPRQVEIAAQTIDRVRAIRPNARVLVDPVMGDKASGLYVKPNVADLVANRLAPKADIISPNLWELGRITNRAIAANADAVAAARKFGRMALVTSMTEGQDIGAAFVTAQAAVTAYAPQRPSAPNGVGDLLAGCFLSAILSHLRPQDALSYAVAAVSDMIAKAEQLKLEDLPLMAGAGALLHPVTKPRIVWA